MGLLETYKRIRYFLRDPDGDVWSDDELRGYWNDAQDEFARKLSLLLRTVAVLPYPPQYDFSYMHDWERDYAHIHGDAYRCLQEHSSWGWVICYPWEAAYGRSDIHDTGTRYTHPWEAAYLGDDAEPVKCLLPDGFHKMIYAAFDNLEILPVSERELEDSDHFYRTRSGTPEWYYRPDEYSRQFVLFPKPGSITWQLPDYPAVLDDIGGLLYDGDNLISQDVGLPSEPMSTVGGIFLWYDRLAVPIDNWSDSDCSYPDWALKWLRHATLERAFGADTDGFIPSLRDYWRKRKEIGLLIARRIIDKRSSVPKYRLAPTHQPARRARGGSLPAGY